MILFISMKERPGALISNYMNYKLIRASSPENAFDYFYSHVNLSYGKVHDAD
jgi:hypothetical protein